MRSASRRPTGFARPQSSTRLWQRGQSTEQPLTRPAPPCAARIARLNCGRPAQRSAPEAWSPRSQEAVHVFSTGLRSAEFEVNLTWERNRAAEDKGTRCRRDGDSRKASAQDPNDLITSRPCCPAAHSAVDRARSDLFRVVRRLARAKLPPLGLGGREYVGMFGFKIEHCCCCRVATQPCRVATRVRHEELRASRCKANRTGEEKRMARRLESPASLRNVRLAAYNIHLALDNHAAMRAVADRQRDRSAAQGSAAPLSVRCTSVQAEAKDGKEAT